MSAKQHLRSLLKWKIVFISLAIQLVSMLESDKKGNLTIPLIYHAERFLISEQIKSFDEKLNLQKRSVMAP